MRALCCLLLMSAVAARAAPLPRVGVAPARVEVTEGARPTLDDDDVAAAVARGLGAGAVQVVPVAEVRGIARRAARAGLVCDAAQPACAARLAAFSGLDFVVVTRVTEAGDGPGVELGLMDGHDGRTLRTRSAPLDDVAVGVAAVAAALLQDAPVVGRLEVRGPAGAPVTVDGAVRGEAPLVVEVDAGLHEVDGRVVRVPAAGLAVVDAVAGGGGGGGGDVAVADVTTAVGIATGVGAGVALVAGIGAFVVAPEAARRDAYTARAWNDAVATGQGLVAVAAVGAAVAVVGALVGVGLWATSVATSSPRAAADGVDLDREAR